MVKIHKMICIDQDINEHLTGLNASSLINDMLRSKFEHADLKGMSKEQLAHEMKKEKLRLKLQEMNNE